MLPDAAPIMPDACVFAGEEVCSNGLDENCSSEPDEGCPIAGSLFWATSMGGSLGSVHGVAVAHTSGTGSMMLLSHAGEATFAAGEPNATTVPAFHAHQNIMSMGRYASDGSLVWARRVAASGGIQDALFSDALLRKPDDGYVVAGRFEDNIVVGPDSTNPVTLNGAPLGGGFLANFDPDGEVLWAQHVWGRGSIRALAHLDDGRFVVAGITQTNMRFAPGEPNQQELDTEGTSAVGFVAWYDTDGSFQHFATLRGHSSSELNLLPGENGEVSIVSAGRVTIDSADTQHVMTTPGTFLARFASSGAIQSVTLLVDGAQNSPMDADIGSGGDIYVTGSYSSSSIFAPGQALEEVTTGLSGEAMFAARFTSQGQMVWLARTGEGYSTRAFGIAADPLVQGGAVVVGRSSGVTVFGAGEAGEVTLAVEPSQSRAFVLRYWSDGTLNWLRTPQGSHKSASSEVSVDPNNTLYVTGSIRGEHIFGAGEPNETTLLAPLQEHGFLAAYDL